MKTQFKDKIILDDDCCFHGLNCALSCDMTQGDNTNDDGCNFPVLMRHHTKRLISDEVTTIGDVDKCTDERTGAVNVIDSISESSD